MPLFKPRPSSPDADFVHVLPPSPPTPPPRAGFFSRRAPTPPLPSQHPHQLPSPPSTTSDASSYRSAASSFFFPGRRRSLDSLRSANTVSTTHTSHTAHTATTAHTRNTSESSRSRNFLGIPLDMKRHVAQTDPKVRMAREKIATAAEAEAEADRAVLHARARVRDALQHIKVLEEEADEEAQRAKAKNAVTRLVSRNARGLGRHG